MAHGETELLAPFRSGRTQHRAQTQHLLLRGNRASRVGEDEATKKTRREHLSWESLRRAMPFRRGQCIRRIQDHLNQRTVGAIWRYNPEGRTRSVNEHWSGRKPNDGAAY